MKNPLIIFSELFRSPLASTPLTEAVFIEFCYDHVNEDYPEVYQDTLSIVKHNPGNPRN